MAHLLLVSPALAWTGAYISTGYNTENCTGTPTYYSNVTSAVKMSSLCSCLSGTVRSGSHISSWTQKQCVQCGGDATGLTTHWTNDCNSDCSQCTGGSGNSSFAAGLFTSSIFDGATCMPLTLTGTSSTPLASSQVLSKMNTTSGNFFDAYASRCLQPSPGGSGSAPNLSPPSSPPIIWSFPWGWGWDWGWGWLWTWWEAHPTWRWGWGFSLNWGAPTD